MARFSSASWRSRSCSRRALVRRERFFRLARTLRVRLLFWLGLSVLAVSALPVLVAMAAKLGRPGLPIAVSLGLSYAAAGGGLVLLAFRCVGRPLRDTARTARTMARGELQRPVVLSAPSTREILELQLVWEDMRRSLVTRLRSSTELNLELESEVARRSAELSRRNAELKEALTRLRSTRDELVRTEKLAAVGRIAANVTSAISTPVNSMAALVTVLSSSLTELWRAAEKRTDQLPGDLAFDPVTPDSAKTDEMLERLLGDARRVGELVRAMRVHARPQEPGGRGPDEVRDEVRRLLSEYAE